MESLVRDTIRNIYRIVYDKENAKKSEDAVARDDQDMHHENAVPVELKLNRETEYK